MEEPSIIFVTRSMQFGVSTLLDIYRKAASTSHPNSRIRLEERVVILRAICFVEISAESLVMRQMKINAILT